MREGEENMMILFLVLPRKHDDRTEDRCLTLEQILGLLSHQLGLCWSLRTTQRRQ